MLLAKLQNHDMAAAAHEGPRSASLLIQPAQLSMELNHQGQDSRQLFDCCVTFTMMPVGSQHGIRCLVCSVQVLYSAWGWAGLDSFSRQLTAQQRPQIQLQVESNWCLCRSQQHPIEFCFTDLFPCSHDILLHCNMRIGRLELQCICVTDLTEFAFPSLYSVVAGKQMGHFVVTDAITTVLCTRNLPDFSKHKKKLTSDCTAEQ